MRAALKSKAADLAGSAADFADAVSKNFDVRDAMLFLGLVMLGGALGTINLAAGIGVPGAILIAVSIFGAR